MKSCFICVFLMVFGATLAAQEQDGLPLTLLQPNARVDEVDVPFEYFNKLIIVSLRINGWLPVKFILDTGAEHTIITKRQVIDLFQIPYEKEIDVLGSDHTRQLKAYIARQVSLSLGDVRFKKDVLVLQEDYFNFDEIAGVPIHGILGAETFRGLAIKINYHKSILTIYAPGAFQAPQKNYTQYPISIEQNKPYINAWLGLAAHDSIPLRLLLDTGAGIATLLHTGTHPRLQLPKNVLPTGVGFGLGGEIKGYIGRISFIRFHDQVFPDIVANFQDLGSIADTSRIVRRNGVIGNEILSRYQVIFDFEHEKLYLRPLKKRHTPIAHDRSGITVIATGTDLGTYVVNSIMPNSPAAATDLRVGDEIRAVNGIPVAFLSLTEISKKLQASPNTNIRIRVRRDRHQRITAAFTLRDLL